MKLARPDTSFDIKESFKEVFETVKEAQEVSEDDQIIAGKKRLSTCVVFTLIHEKVLPNFVKSPWQTSIIWMVQGILDEVIIIPKT